MRTDEWKERKRMTNNYQDNVQTQITVEAQKALDDTRKKEKEDIELLYLNNFNENVIESISTMPLIGGSGPSTARFKNSSETVRVKV